MILITPDRRALVAAATVAAAAFSVQAGAATISSSDNFTIDTTTGASATETLDFSRFNSALGTLTGVSLSLTGSADPVLVLFTTDTTAPTFANGSESSDFGFSSGAGVPTATTHLSLSGASGTANAATSGPFALTNVAGASTPVQLSGAVSPSNFASYEGSGNAEIGVGFVGQFPFTSGGTPTKGNVSFGGGGQANGELTVTYTYTPVPLPAALPLLLAGGLGLLPFRRRRVAVSQ